MTKSKPALLGGQPVFERSIEWTSFWPPVDDSTANRLRDLYFSRRWSSFDETEPAFDQAFANYHGARHGIFMVNGTVTLECALGAYGVGAGDEVIVPPLTWYATAMAPHYLGARPVFVDIRRDTLCIDPDKIAAAITDRTKAIIPVHVFGSMADMDRIMAIARAHRLKVIEDCAHVHGGLWNEQGIGSVGDVGSFSFQQSKTMASAEGGICITNDEEIAERLFRMKHIGYGPGQRQGQAQSGPPPGLLCHNYRATAFQALILHEQLKTLEHRLEQYREAVAYLEKRLAQTTKIRFQARPQQVRRQGYYLWVMIFDAPSYADIPIALIQKALNAEGVQASRTWDPVYRFILFNLRPEAYRTPQPCTVTEQVASRILALHHSYLALDMPTLEKFADAIEKVMAHMDDLRRFAT
jgi:dTDP-4-amino-4,6-dideoxygalactose transaminase